MNTDAGHIQVLQGTGVSSGLVIGKVVNAIQAELKLPMRSIKSEDFDAEWQRLTAARKKSKRQLACMQEHLSTELSEEHAEILTFQIMMLDDPMLLQAVEEIMRQKLICVEQAANEAIEQFCQQIKQLQDAFFRERIDDITDLATRLLRNLTIADSSDDDKPCDNLDCAPQIMVAAEIPPSAAAHLDPRQVAAFITAGGSRTSHTAILARALGIPAIVAVTEGFEKLQPGMIVAIDGESGKIFLNPDKKMIQDFSRENSQQKIWLTSLLSENNKPAETLDGYQVCLGANVELPSEAMTVQQRYNVGIGLFRTEFLFLNSGKLLSEEEQFAAYKTTVETVHPHSVIFRTLDIGGDKFLSQVKMSHEHNPFMGMRAIRFSLHYPELFRIQLRAMLRASVYGKLRIMFPLISTFDELEHALEHLEEVKQEMRRSGIPFNDNFDVGCMIEVPAAAILAEKLVHLVDFFSIGTNDLVQYSLAVDRSNPDIAFLYQPPHPAILHLINQVVKVACEHGKWVSLCGEMAAEALYTPLVLGLGVHELSMSPIAIPPIRHLIRSIRMHDAESLVDASLCCSHALEVEALCRDMISKNCPEMLSHTKKLSERPAHSNVSLGRSPSWLRS